MENRKRTIRQLHALMSKIDSIETLKPAILTSYKVEHVSEMSDSQLLDCVRRLSKELKKNSKTIDDKMDKMRKRLMGVCAGYLERQGLKPNTELIYAVCCRAAKVDRFNDIEPCKLRSLYYTFKNKQKEEVDVKSPVRNITEVLARLNSRNIRRIEINFDNSINLKTRKKWKRKTKY